MHPPEPLIGTDFVCDVLANTEEGDVFLTRERMHFTNLFIPGFWSHAAIFDGDEIAEAVGEGIRAVAPQEFLFKKDWVLHLRPTFINDDDEKQKVRDFLTAQLGKKYDFEFSAGIKTWYCSELVYAALKAGNAKAPFNLRHTFGVPTVTPQDFENAVARGKFKIITDSRRYEPWAP